ncbi:unnamed protein product, partial [Vitis vinifera]|uniref:Uncharacterized protein n=1 Tax=Vitis vinifera TaxID=29760 RepID=E0CTA2_VITVI
MENLNLYISSSSSSIANSTSLSLIMILATPGWISTMCALILLISSMIATNQK